MNRTEKFSIPLGFVLEACAIFFICAILMQFFAYGANQPPIFKIGSILFSVYGFSSILVPIFLFVAGLSLFLKIYTFRTSVYLGSSILPFVSVVFAERIAKFLLLTDNSALLNFKIAAVFVICALLIAIEYLLIGILADFLSLKRAEKANKNEKLAETEDFEEQTAFAKNENLGEKEEKIENAENSQKGQNIEQNEENLSNSNNESEIAFTPKGIIEKVQIEDALQSENLKKSSNEKIENAQNEAAAENETEEEFRSAFVVPQFVPYKEQIAQKGEAWENYKDVGDFVQKPQPNAKAEKVVENFEETEKNATNEGENAENIEEKAEDTPVFVNFKRIINPNEKILPENHPDKLEETENSEDLENAENADFSSNMEENQIEEIDETPSIFTPNKPASAESNAAVASVLAKNQPTEENSSLDLLRQTLSASPATHNEIVPPVVTAAQTYEEQTPVADLDNFTSESEAAFLENPFAPVQPENLEPLPSFEEDFDDIEKNEDVEQILDNETENTAEITPLTSEDISVAEEQAFKTLPSALDIDEENLPDFNEIEEENADFTEPNLSAFDEEPVENKNNENFSSSNFLGNGLGNPNRQIDNLEEIEEFDDGEELENFKENEDAEIFQNIGRESGDFNASDNAENIEDFENDFAEKENEIEQVPSIDQLLNLEDDEKEIENFVANFESNEEFAENEEIEPAEDLENGIGEIENDFDASPNFSDFNNAESEEIDSINDFEQNAEIEETENAEEPEEIENPLFENVQSPSVSKPIKAPMPYSIPAEGLLETYPDNQYWIIDAETQRAANILKQTLSEFKIEAEVTGIRKGPVITMFEILPAPGVKLNRIVALQDNIALRLAASSVRIVAPIPGKHAVGIEVPNKQRSIVGFKELIDNDSPLFNKMEIPVVLGKDITGEAKLLDLAATPHLLIAGSTGSGKSVCVNTMILSILYKRSPQQVKMILIDPKIVELKLYNDIPHLLTPVITEPKKAFQSLQYCLCEMERRYALLDHMGVRDIKSYNKRIEERNIANEKLPYIVVIIDEFADLMATTGKELESTVSRLAAMSRAVGIHLVLATQRPSVDVITGLIKANIPTRIAFMVAAKMDSRIIIDQVGAEKLLGKGDMLYASAVDPFPVRIQGTYVTENEVENVVEYVKRFGEPEYIDEEIFFEEEEEENEPGLFVEGDDPLYEKALDIVLQAGKASASYIQRRLKIGYNRAARLVEEMEERGIVGPANGSKPRDIIHVPSRPTRPSEIE